MRLLSHTQGSTELIIDQIDKTREKEFKMRDKVEEILKQVRPSLQADGGDLELVDVNQGIVKVRLKGACGSCPMSTMTLKNGVERLLKEKLPEIKEVVAV